ncbi:MAG: lipocalin-like domain-containing protein [Pseudomonadota bacterium]
MAKRIASILALLCAMVTLADESDAPPSQLSELLGKDADPAFARAIEPREFSFPADHGPHPDFRNEWWYVTGNLDDEDGQRFGFELTLFRFSLTPTVAASDSAWRTNQLYIAHLAVTDADGERFFVAQRYSRGSVGLAGAEAEPFRVWIDDWFIQSRSADRWNLRAADEQFGIELELTPLKAPILNGIDGLSKKSAQRGNASYYYSITRLQTEGRLRIGERDYRVSGFSWLDREWSTSALAADQAGWDWYALQLDDNSELMFYELRKTDGRRDAASAGTFINADGTALHLNTDEVEIDVIDTWTSPNGGTYPSRWLMRVPRLGLDLTVTPILDDQELFTTVRYWEGAVDVVGDHDGNKVTGRGYVELTGYAE